MKQIRLIKLLSASELPLEYVLRGLTNGVGRSIKGLEYARIHDGLSKDSTDEQVYDLPVLTIGTFEGTNMVLYELRKGEWRVASYEEIDVLVEGLEPDKDERLIPTFY